MTQPNSHSSEYAYLEYAVTGLRGCISRSAEPFVDDVGDLVEFWMAGQNLQAKSYFLYHTNYVTGIGKDDIYIV